MWAALYELCGVGNFFFSIDKQNMLGIIIVTGRIWRDGARVGLRRTCCSLALSSWTFVSVHYWVLNVGYWSQLLRKRVTALESGFHEIRRNWFLGFVNMEKNEGGYTDYWVSFHEDINFWLHFCEVGIVSTFPKLKAITSESFQFPFTALQVYPSIHLLSSPTRSEK